MLDHSLLNLRILVVGPILWFATDVLATNRYYSDITASSPNGRYTVEAKSPDNASGDEHHAFQDKFLYTCIDTHTDETLWTRHQPMEAPSTAPNGDLEDYEFPEEGSPSSIYVSDTAWTVIRTGWDEIISVDRHGNDRGPLHLLSEAFTEEERDRYVHDTTAGPMWAGNSLWYFLNVEDKHVFVIRPWWGKRIFIGLEECRLLKEADSLTSTAANQENQFVMTTLKESSKLTKSSQKQDCCSSNAGSTLAAHLAGTLKVKQAVPLLRTLEDSSYSGSSVMCLDDDLPPAIANWREMTLRKAVHLSLRRLGQKPSEYPCNTFAALPASMMPTQAPRADGVVKLEKGMRPNAVISHIGSPDYIDRSVWYFDIDAEDPYTLELSWGKAGVDRFKKITPPLWTTDKWDEELAY